MTKKRQPLSIIDRFLNMTSEEISELNFDELKSLTRKIVKEANRRIKRIEKSKVYSPITEYIKQNGGNFKMPKGNDRDRYMTELLRARVYLDSPISTVTGARTFLSNVMREMRKYGLDFVSDTYEAYPDKNKREIENIAMQEMNYFIDAAQTLNSRHSEIAELQFIYVLRNKYGERAANMDSRKLYYIFLNMSSTL